MFDSLNSLLGPAYFWLFSVIALGCGLGVLVAKHPLNAAINLIGVMIALGGLYSLLSSPFMGVLQLLVYAGAIMMLVVFVIMVLNKAHDREVPRFDWLSLVAAAAPVALAIPLFAIAAKAPATAAAGAPATPGTVANLAPEMFRFGGGWWLLFLAIGVLLLVAITGAVALAKRRLDQPPADHDDAQEAGHGH
jgi:NADH-quinone oxidoreductase subunit J